MKDNIKKTYPSNTKAASKEAPKVAPKMAPKSDPKVAPKVASKFAPKAAPKVAPKFAPKVAPKPNSRLVAVRILNKIVESDAYSNIELSRELSRITLEDRDKALVTEIVNGTLRNLTKLDFIIDFFTNDRTVDPVTRNILRISFYQMIYLDKIPDNAILNEAGEAARILLGEGPVKFINAILRNYTRRMDEIVFPKREDNLEEFLCLEYSFPKWLIKMWIKRFGNDFTEALLVSLNERPDLSLRINLKKISVEDYSEILKEKNILFTPGKYSDRSIKINGSHNIEKLPGYSEGHFIVQDEASILSVTALTVKHGERVLDLCSAPGGKTTLISELLNDTGTLLAGDIHPHKLKLVNENLRRLELKDVTVKLMDATVFDESLRNRFDKILLDAPCTGYGVMRKKPDMKYKKSLAEIQSLVEVQRKMITNASKYLRKGGILVYSTCTISEDENENMIKWAIEGNNGLKLESLKGILPSDIVSEDGMVRLYPNIHETDGFFIARMKK